MKSNDLIVLGLAGLAAYMLVKASKGTTGTAGIGGILGAPVSKPASLANGGMRSVTDTVNEIFSSAGKTFDNGWRYFTDGTAIDPMGNYYFQGQQVWQNPDTVAYI